MIVFLRADDLTTQFKRLLAFCLGVAADVGLLSGVGESL